MDKRLREIIHDRFAWRGYATISPMDRAYIEDSYCTVSFLDFTTGPSLRAQEDFDQRNIVEKAQMFGRTDQMYDIRKVKCLTPPSRWSGPLGICGDHAFMGDTLQKALVDDIREINGKYGFYKNTR